MLDRILKALKKAGPELTERILPRLAAVRESSKSIGWGYHDYLCGALAEAFPDGGA